MKLTFLANRLTRWAPMLCVLALLTSMAPRAIGQAATPRLAGTAASSAALASDGRVWTWGSNTFGQLGRTISATTSPSMVPGLSGIVDIACGGSHMLALTSAGMVFGWGRNNFGQLGLGSTLTQWTPQLLPSITGAAKIAAGDTHSLVLLTNGTVLAFGEGGLGRLGIGNSTTQLVPVLIPGLNNIINVSAGATHSAAVASNGTLHLWGNNSSGQLGISAIWSSASPLQVPSLPGISTVACGHESTLCLDGAGVLRQWGNTSAATTQPQVIVTPAPIIAIDSASSITCQIALAPTGALYAWGQDCNGLLGTNSATCASVTAPIQLSSLGTGNLTMALGGLHGMTMTAAGSVQTWGSNGSQQLGYSTTGTTSATPATIPGMSLHVFSLFLAPVGQATELRYFHGSPASVYANMCTSSNQAATTSGLINFGGLWLSFGDFLAWSTFIQAGYPMATGSINALGTAVTTLPMPNSALAGLTINAVSFNLGATGITHTSPVVTHTF